MPGRTESPFAAHAILHSFAVAQVFCNETECIGGKADPLKLLVIANIFSILIDTLKKLQFSKDFKAVQINSDEVINLEIQDKPQVISVREFKQTGTPYLSFADAGPLGFTPHLTGLQPVA